MTTKHTLPGTWYALIGVALCAAVLLAPMAFGADDERQIRLQSHLQAIENSVQIASDHLAADFEDRFSTHFVAQRPAPERQQLLEEVQQAVRQAGAIMLREHGDRVIMELHGPNRYELELAVEAQPPYAIDALVLRPATAPPALSLDRDPHEILKQLAIDQGFSGTVAIIQGGVVTLHQAYGMADPSLQQPNRIDTIFGIGSTPIDFTIAAVLMLAEDGLLALDVPISRYLPNVPADKATMTVGHLLDGQSGLPDFFHRDQDWDADLAWIDRDSAVRRILGSPLRFAPGTEHAHSHAAYVLLAALVESITGASYGEFLQQRIFAPAGMTRTGFYGDAGSWSLQDFAVGAGPNRVGLPNIPPNWGPTSWLIMGSGGMYSTAQDMMAFYAYMRSGVLKQSRRYHQPTIGIGGSDRGFYYFHAYNGSDNEAILLSNGDGHGELLQSVSAGLQTLVEAAAVE